MAEARYPTKPLECWQKAKELRQEHYREVMTAREQGKLLVYGGTVAFFSLPAGLGDNVFLGGEPYGATVAGDIPFLDECVTAVEARGYARDLCTYMRNYWGSMFLNRFYFGGEFPRPDFCFQLHFCDVHAEWFQVVAEHFNVPFFCIDFPIFQEGEKRERSIQYIVAQAHEAIEWMEKITGRKYDDERLLNSLTNEWRTMRLWAEIMALNQAIPAPLTERLIYTLYTPSALARQRREVVDLYEMILDEVKERVAQGIAALSSERCRLLFDNPPPWFNLNLLRYIESYGCALVGSFYTLNLGGQVAQREDGTFVPAPTPQELGVPLRTRDDLLWAMATWQMDNLFTTRLAAGHLQKKIDQVLQMVKQWHGDGMVMHINRGCEGLAAGQMEIRQALVDADIPVVAYEGNMGDRREFDEAETLSRIDAFMERLGLTKLEMGK